MGTVFDNALNGKEENHLFPFLWMMGESREQIGQELEIIRSCGIRAVCLESRPHPDFAGPGWWADLDFVIAKAKELDMKIWILDDDHFPTGHAVGRFSKEASDLKKTYLAQTHADVLGGVEQAYLYRAMAEKDAHVLAVLAVRRNSPDTSTLDCSEVYDVTDGICGDFCFFRIPSHGLYRIFTIYTTQENGGRDDYMNLIDSESVKILIDAVYEPHYRHFKDEFGKTILGFFSDEPELGNVPGYPYDNHVGMENNKLPWSNELQEAIRKRFGARWLIKLLGCWYDVGEETPQIRIAYMDEVTNLVYRCFSGQLGDWCRSHGVEYIGHVIEDCGASMNLGCSIGHYFREMKGQAIAGIDVVHHQTDPGQTGAVHAWLTGEYGGDFFHFQLAKLGSSAAHLDEEKKGRSLCEIFGSYGWGLDIPNMKWLADHMMVRGINHFVPHAFSVTDPNPDCPPHFFAQGNNPQFPYFRVLMQYINRVSDLISGGEPVLTAAVLYPAKAHWTGRPHESLSTVCRCLMEHQIDFDIVPGDVLSEFRKAEGENTFGRTGNEYRALVVPGGEYLEREVCEFAKANPEIPVLLCGPVPDRDTCGNELCPADYPGLRTVSLQQCAEILKERMPSHLQVETSCSQLRMMHYRRPDGALYYFFNEDVYEPAEISVKGSFGSVVLYDAVSNTSRIIKTPDGSLKMSLEPGMTRLCSFQEETTGETVSACSSQELALPMRVSIREGDRFIKVMDLRPGEPFRNMNRLYPDYTGTFRYETTFLYQKGEETDCCLILPYCGNGAEVYVNDRKAGTVLQDHQKVNITGLLREGENDLRIDMNNTLVWKRPDPVSAFAQIRASGLCAFPILEKTTAICTTDG